jgi:DMSO/TMAO reductase YedYZ molybdopterin-dependent catalytic subunit
MVAAEGRGAFAERRSGRFAQGRTSQRGGTPIVVTPGTDAALRVVSTDPFNAETILEGVDGIVTPAGRHFVRSHFSVPEHPGVLTIDGGTGSPLILTVADLVRRPAVTVLTTIECAGNGRAHLDPPAPGEPWRLGAVGTAAWTGIRLDGLLDDAALAPSTVEVLFRGADSGTPAGLDGAIAFERSLPVADTVGPIVAFEMNGEPLTAAHGAPFRLVVPGWYGMASVKWLTHVVARTTPFRGFYQADRYVIDDVPIREMAPRAVVVSPADGARVGPGPLTIRGYAWSGGTPVVLVEVSVDGGDTWRDARLGPADGAAWRAFELSVAPETAGRLTILARATDGRGERQPLTQVRTALGYRNNAAQPVVVEVVAPD